MKTYLEQEMDRERGRFIKTLLVVSIIGLLAWWCDARSAHATEMFQFIPRVQVGEAWGVSIPNGSTTVNSTPPATLFGLGTAIRLNDQWNLVADLVLVVPRAKFYPGFRPVVGLAHKFKGWSFAGTLMYQYSPPWADGSKPAHTIGATLGPGIPLAAAGATLSFGVGYRAQFVGGKTNHVLAFGPTLLFSF